MDTIDKHIVAIDLGTSKIALTVAKVEGNDVQIIYYKETESAGIRYSSVFNV
jgi:cell division protein FtsA